ncbi:MAG: 3-isopropylmalate dehydratase small subunit, partial [Candidatus Latescibacterota bacterium]
GISKKVEDGGELEIALGAGVVRKLTKWEEYMCNPWPDLALEIMRAGGLLEYLRGREG